MNREERIVWSRRKAAENAPGRARQRAEGEAARRRRTTTYGELRVAADESTGMKIGHRRFADPAMSVIRSG